MVEDCHAHTNIVFDIFGCYVRIVYIILATPVQLPHRFTVRIFKRAMANISSDLSKIVLKTFSKSFSKYI